MDKRKKRGKKNGKKGIIQGISYDSRIKRKQSLRRETFKTALKETQKEDWNLLKSFGYTAGTIFNEGLKSCMNQLATKRVDESLYGEYEAYLMFKRRKTKYGFRHEPRRIRAKLHPTAVSYNRIVIISLTPCPKGNNMVIVRYYLIDSNTINRKEIHSVRKKVNYIAEEILLFFANGGNHSA